MNVKHEELQFDTCASPDDQTGSSEKVYLLLTIQLVRQLALATTTKNISRLTRFRVV